MRLGRSPILRSHPTQGEECPMTPGTVIPNLPAGALQQQGSQAVIGPKPRNSPAKTRHSVSAPSPDRFVGIHAAYVPLDPKVRSVSPDPCCPVIPAERWRQTSLVLCKHAARAPAFFCVQDPDSFLVPTWSLRCVTERAVRKPFPLPSSCLPHLSAAALGSVALGLGLGLGTSSSSSFRLFFLGGGEPSPCPIPRIKYL